MATAAKKTAARKPAAKKATAKKAGAKKTPASKTAVKKPAAKKVTASKVPGGKAPAARTPVTQPLPSHEEVGRISEENLKAMASDIDRQMKMLAEMNTRVLIAKDQLADFQEKISARIKAFQAKNAGKPTENLKDIMTSIRETKDEAAKMIKDSKALHETYEVVSRNFEKGRAAAAKEMKKAEAVFLEKLREVEAKVMKKAGEIKKNLKN
jgi:hypothetical protein